MKNLLSILLIIACLAIAILATNRPKERIKVERHTDTLVIRDTLRVEVPIPYKVYVTRIDSVVMYSIDSVEVAVEIPIERKEYKSDDFHAIIEGFKPQLISIDVYPKTSYITNTELRTITKRHRWGVGVQVGYGLTPTKIEPYIGVGISYNLWTW